MAVSAAAVVAMAAGLSGQGAPQTGAPAPAAQGAGRGGGGGQDACGGRSAQPTVPCQNDVNKMMATLGLLPDKPPAAPQRARKVIVLAPEHASGYQHSSIPLAARLIEELGKKTGAWTTDIVTNPSGFTADNLKQYDAIFLSSTTGTFLDDPNDEAATAARRQALLDFVRGGKGLAGIHASGDSYHGGGRGRGAGGRGAAGAPAAAPGTAAPASTGTPANSATASQPVIAPPQQQPLPPCSHRNNEPGGGGAPLWPDFNKMIGGYFKFHWVYPTPITVKIDDPSNPINAAFKGQSFNTIDETYTFNETSWSRDNVHVLTSIDYSKMSDCEKGLEDYPRTDHDYGLSWIRRDGNGRVFYQALGHHESIYYNNPAMLAHILAGMQYALGDLKADDSPSAKAKK